MDGAAQQDLQQLGTLCGGSFNLDGLFNRDGSLPDVSLDSVVDGTCTTTCAPGYECIGGYCIIDMIANAALSDADAVALANCLGGDGTTDPIVILGQEPVCLWRDMDSDNLLCTGTSNAAPCPGRMRDSDLETCVGAPPAGNDWIPPSEQVTLGLISSQSAGGTILGSTFVTPLDCDLVRRARNGDTSVIAQIVESNFFSIENVRAWAERIGWRGYPMNMSEYTIDGGHWVGTGNSVQSLGGTGLTPGEWPCSPMDPADVNCADPGDSLFCSTVDCSPPLVEDNIAFMNDRMARAAIVLAVMSGYGLSNLRLPALYGTSPGEVDLYGIDGRSVGPATSIGGTTSSWTLGTGATWEGWSLAGLVAVPLSDPDDQVWYRPGGTAESGEPAWSATGVTTLWPVGFINYGRAQRDPTAARRITEAFWTGMSTGRGPLLQDVGFSTTNDVVACNTLEHFGLGCDELLENRSGDAVHGFFRAALDGRPVRLDGYPFGQSGRNGWITDYWREPVAAVNSEPSGGTNFRTNVLHIANSGFYRRDALDALELMCQAASVEDELCDELHPPAALSTDDLPQTRAYLRCMARRVERAGQRIVLQNVPHRVVQMMRGEPVPIVPDEGAYAANVDSFRDSLQSIGEIPRAIAMELSGFADDLQQLEYALDGIGARRTILDLNAAANTVSETGSCAAAVASLTPAAVAVCASSIAQIGIHLRMRDVEAEALTPQAQSLIVQFNSSFEARNLHLAQLADQMTHQANAAETTLANLHSDRRQAAWHLAGAFFASSDSGGDHFNQNVVYRRQYNTLRSRYLEAHEAAVRYALIARRALEQRLGADITSLATNRPLSLVDDPRQWANDACNSSGINYARLRDETDPTFENYSGEYIGDYVRRLERVLESYRLDYPYTSAGDTAVISLRDDIWGIRTFCPAPSYNLLASSGNLSQQIEPLPEGGIPTPEDLGGDPPTDAWGDSGCVENGSGVVENCVTAAGLSDAGLVVDGAGPDDRATGAFRVTFVANDDTASFTSAADWGQSLPLPAGVYRLSWYGRCVSDGTVRDPRTAVELEITDSLTGTAVATTVSSRLQSIVPVCGDGLCNGDETSTSCSMDCTAGATCRDWTRYFQFISFGAGTNPRTARIRIRPASGVTSEHSVDIAAVQLEFVGDRVFDDFTMLDQSDADLDSTLYYPRPFVATSSFGTAPSQPVCEDDGSRFRHRWAYDCLPLCVQGIGVCGTDDDGNVTEVGTQSCFWETEIDFSLGALERRQILPNGGFAVGNFNYRIDQVGVNFVGTGTRACSGVGAPGACNANANILYSIEHLPELGASSYPVRNYVGDPYPAQLFRGEIEHARGLASERYMTNPLSSADQSQMASYMRSELRGRPLSGRFRIRIWDEPGVSFHNIEDLQLVLEYRYLTRTPAP